MDLRQTILEVHSKAQCNKIIKWVGNSQQRFDELFNLFLNDEYRVVQRSAWPVSYCVIEHPEFISKHFSQLLKNLKKPNLHVAVKRNIVRLLQYIETPKKYHGRVMDICFNYLSSNEETVAVKAFSITVLEKLSGLYPEIKNELKLIVEERWPYESVAFRTRAKKFLLS